MKSISTVSWVKPGTLRLLGAGLFGFALMLAADVAFAGPHQRPDHPAAPAFAFNPTTPAKAKLGCRLFFDTRLSKANDTSCASCHDPAHGWTDTRRKSRGALDVAEARRTQTVLGTGFVPKLGWSGGIDALEGFVLAPIARAHEMAQGLDALVVELSSSAAYSGELEAAFGSSEVTVGRISQALAAFVRTLVPGVAPIDRWQAGDQTAVSDSAKEGFDLFTGEAGCAACHTGWRFTDDAFHDIGLEAGSDIGRAVHEPNNPLARYAFKTPTLRDVALRPPYMHDGSMATLRDVVDHYSALSAERESLSPLLPTLNLSDREKLNLVDFLLTLTSDRDHTFKTCLPERKQK
jgi:cytochrome c peroxidase